MSVRSASAKSISAIRRIDELEFQNLTKAIEKVRQFSAHQSLYTLCLRNHADLTATWSNYEAWRQTSGELNDIIRAEVTIELNRRLLNYLTTFRTFVDHWTKTMRAAKRTGTDAGFNARFEKTFERLESRCFEFQFFWQYRNFVQHVGLPNIGLPFSARATSGSGTGIFRTTSALLDRDSLLQSGYDWKGVKQLLQLQPEQIDLFDQLRLLAQRLDRLNSLCSQANLSWVSDAFDFLMKRCIEVKAADPDGIPAIADLGDFTPSSVGKSAIKNFSLLPLPLHLMSEVQETREKP